MDNYVKTALVCIAKNEDRYIHEWITYHLKLGFDNIFVYMNNWRCGVFGDRLHLIPFDGDCKQFAAYNHFIVNYSREYQWVAFFDVDEFLVLHNHNTISDFISNYKNENGVGINWCMVTSHILDTQLNENSDSVIKRFFYRERDQNQHIKTVINFEKCRIDNINIEMNHPHIPFNVELVDPKFNKLLNTPFNFKYTIDVAQINHYYYKSLPEFKLKVERGRADIAEKYKLTDKWNEQSTDIIYDTSAYYFMYG